MNLINTFIFKILVIMAVTKLKTGLQIIHNVPDFLLASDQNYKDELIFQSKKDDSSTKHTRQPILELYLPNITVQKGNSACLKCPSFFDQQRSDQAESDISEYFKIKTVIWTQEVSQFPKLISNDNDMLSKNKRYSLQEAPLFNSTISSGEIMAIFGRSKFYNLKIERVEASDTGWYSCYIVKRDKHEQNVKYFIYLKVLDSQQEILSESSVDYAILKNYRDTINTNKYWETILETTTMVSYKEPKLFDYILRKNDILKKKFGSFQLDPTKEHSYFVSAGVFDKEKQSLILPPIDEYTKKFLKDTTLKREIENVSEKSQSKITTPELMVKSNLQLTTTVKTTTINTTTTTYTNSKVTTKMPTPRQNNSMTAAKITLTEKMPVRFEEYPMVSDELSVFPKFLNTSEEDTLQLECKYTGLRYLTLKLMWFKNDLIMRIRKEPHRIIHLDYKQNLTRISILKFTRSHRRDSGLYKCVAFDENKELIGEEQLKLLVNQRPLQDINESYFGIFSSYLMSRGYVNRESDFLKILSVILCSYYCLNFWL